MSTDQTEQLGEQLAVALEPPCTIELVADLGGGKTTLVKGLARGLGCQDIISSPTFTISREYACRDQVFLHHYDFYRLSEPGLLLDEISESIGDDRVITVIEWGASVQSVLPRERLQIKLEAAGLEMDHRSITLHYPAKLYEVIEQIKTNWTT